MSVLLLAAAALAAADLARALPGGEGGGDGSRAFQRLTGGLGEGLRLHPGGCGPAFDGRMPSGCDARHGPPLGYGVLCPHPQSHGGDSR